MNKLLILIIACALLGAGCTVPDKMSNEERIIESQKCLEGGMDYWIDGYRRVQCTKP